jgi:hypothetical protein
MCTPTLMSGLSGAASATTGSGAPYGFGGSSPAAAMPDVLTPGNATLALGAAGGAMSFMGAVGTAHNTITADNAQAETARTNALIAEQAAASAYTSGAASVANTETKGAQTIASQRAAMAANGIDVNAAGTATNVQASTKFVTDQNVATITANAARAAMGYNQQEDNDVRAAGQYGAAASAVSPALAGATSLLTSASGVASNWYRNQRAGVV